MRLLVVEDDPRLAAVLARGLRENGYAVDRAADGGAALEHLHNNEYDAVVLDLMIPGIDGMEVCRRLRRERAAVPVLMLTARGEEADRIVGLEMGADDYLPKTFSTRELLARLRSVMRRAHSASPIRTEEQEVVVGALRINPGARVVVLGDEPLLLTPVEFDLLLSLARAKGRVKTREALLDEIRDRDYDVFDRSVDVHISALRKKLGDDPKTPRFIRTVRSAGYMCIEPDDA